MTLPVVVAGEALVDLVPTKDGTLGIQLGGGPFNTARALGRLGQRAAFVGCISTDRLGQALADTLAADGVTLPPLLRTDRPTSLAMAQVDDSGSATYSFYLAGTSVPALTPDLALKVLPQALSALHVGSLGLAVPPLAAASEVLVKAVHGRSPVMLDANVRPAVIPDMDDFRARLMRLLALTDILKVSDADLALLMPGVPALEAARSMLAQGCKLILLTLGAQGAIVIRASETTPVLAPKVTAVDTIGAGDIFSGAWLARFLRLGGDLTDADRIADATRYACHAASLSCTRSGAAPPTRDELDKDVSSVTSKPTPS